MKIPIAIGLFLLLFLTAAAGGRSPAPPASGEPAWGAMYAAFKEGGEPALRTWVEANRPAVTRELLADIATRGWKERSDPALSEARLAIALAAAQEIGDTKAEADAVRWAGEYNHLTAKTEKALACFDRARELYEAIGDLSGQGHALLGRGKVLYQTGDRAQAMALFDKALPLLEQANDVTGQGNVYCLRGDVFRMTADVAKATAMYDKALPLFEQAKDALGQGDVYFGMSSVAFYKGDTAQSETMCQKALPFFESVGAVLEQGHVCRRLGQVAFQRGEYDKALTLYEKALVYYKEARDIPDQGNICMMRGDIYFMIGDNRQARAMYEQALPFFQQANQAAGQGFYFRAMGNTYRKAGQYAQALLMFDKALPFLERAGSPDGQANVYMGRADVYLSTGEYAQALATYEKALPLYEKASHTLGQGMVLLNRGLILARTGERAQALAMYEKALPFFEKIRNFEAQGNTHYCRGAVYVDNGDDVQAKASFEKALPFFEKVNAPVGLGAVYKSLGGISFRKGEEAEALALYDQALGYFTKCESLGDEAVTRTAIAKVHAEAGRHEQALALYEQALDLLEQARRNAGLDELKLSFMAAKLSSFEAATSFMLDRGFREQAFRTAERMKARVFLDRLAEGLVDLDKGVDPELRRRRDELESRSSALVKMRLDLKSAKLDEAERGRRDEKMRADIESVGKELAEVRERIRLTNPLYASVQYPRAPTPAEIRDVLREGEVLLEYFLTGKQAWCFVLSRSSFDVVRLPGTPSEIAAGVSMLVDWAASEGRGAPRGEGAGTASPEAEDGGAARRLYDVLVAPVAGRLAARTLIIVPDGALARLPFEMLDAGTGPKPKPLLRSHRVRYAPSAAVLAFYRTKYRREGTSERFAGFGDPVYDHESYAAKRSERGVGVAGRGLAGAGVVLARLPGTGEEVRAIGELFAGRKKGETAYLRLEASEEHAKGKELEGCAYIHFAAHGLLDDDFQAIALSQVPGAGEDGLLTLPEIMNLHWDARLVVLSACETGLGPVRRGEGVTGLTRAVMYAGSPAAVVSLWSVPDEGTKELMTRFYGAMAGKGLSPADALRRAKLEMAAMPKWRSPYYWAAFVLYGE